MKLLMLAIVILVTLFLLLSHPLILGAILLAQAIIIALTTSFLIPTPWYAYIMFIVMISGMMILFAYMISTASNEKFKFSSSLFVIWALLTFTTFVLLIVLDTFYTASNINLMILNDQDFLLKLEISMQKYTNWPYCLILYLLASYLLVTLIMVVKIINMDNGPFRRDS